jgi:23S rRNA (cytosine1962-C5)-methyltransferase
MILKLEKQREYELVDSGLGQKLEKYGPYTFARPDPEALWNRSLTAKEWDNADLKFIRKGTRTQWIIKEGIPKSWTVEFGGLTFSIKPTSFKHTGLFPEQLLNWQWMEEVIKNENRKVKVLNLFAYTGGASLAAARAGAEVCHVDGSKTAVAWARENAELSGLSEAPIRWIVEDVILFLKREIKRGNKYDAIIMDPPSFGHGPKDELWKIEESFLGLIQLCKEILSDDPLFVLINGYTAGYSPITYQNNLMDMMTENKGSIEVGELTIKESNTQRLLPCGIFARWQKN